MTAKRKEVRQALAAGLATGLPTAQQVYRFQKGGFAGQTPVVRVMSAGSDRPRLTVQGNQSEFHFLVQIWVLYAKGDAGWDEEDAEDTLDQLEYELAAWVEANARTSSWGDLRYAGRSTIDIVRYEGEGYLVEDVPVAVRVYG